VDKWSKFVHGCCRNGYYATPSDKLLKTAASRVEMTVVISTSKGAVTLPRRLAARLAVALGVALTVVCACVMSAVVLLHLEVRPVLTGSMVPTYGPGALLVTRSVPTADLHKGMIVLFVPPGEHAEYAHRITSVTGSAGHPIITTKGDANKAADPWHAQLNSSTVPEVVTSVPWVGRLMVGLRGPIQLALIVIGGAIVAVSGTRRILHSRPVRRLPA
jgi:signal peptidase I